MKTTNSSKDIPQVLKNEIKEKAKIGMHDAIYHAVQNGCSDEKYLLRVVKKQKPDDHISVFDVRYAIKMCTEHPDIVKYIIDKR